MLLKCGLIISRRVTGNQLTLKINETIPINQIQTGLTQVKLNIDQIYMGYNSTVNNYYEVWTASTILPAETGDYAGNIEFDVHMTDHDAAGGNRILVIHLLYWITSTSIHWHWSGDGQLIRLEINPLVWVNQSANGLLYSYNQGDSPIIDIYINATDADGPAIGITTIGYTIVIQSSTGPSTENEIIKAGEIQNGTNYYIIEIDTGTLITQTDIHSISLTALTIADADAGHCDPSKFVTSAELLNLQFTLDFQVNNTPKINLLTIIIALSIVGVIGVAFFGVWFYRRYISYRKYLSKED